MKNCVLPCIPAASLFPASSVQAQDAQCTDADQEHEDREVGPKEQA
jgi:hypothetical protein